MIAHLSKNYFSFPKTQPIHRPSSFLGTCPSKARLDTLSPEKKFGDDAGLFQRRPLHGLWGRPGPSRGRLDSSSWCQTSRSLSACRSPLFLWPAVMSFASNSPHHPYPTHLPFPLTPFPASTAQVKSRALPGPAPQLSQRLSPPPPHSRPQPDRSFLLASFLPLAAPRLLLRILTPSLPPLRALLSALRPYLQPQPSPQVGDNRSRSPGPARMFENRGSRPQQQSQAPIPSPHPPAGPSHAPGSAGPRHAAANFPVHSSSSPFPRS